MGCLHSNESKKKYLDSDPFEESENRPPADCEMTKKRNEKTMKQSHEKKLVQREDNQSVKSKDNKSVTSRKEDSVQSSKKVQSITKTSEKQRTQPINRPVKIIRSLKQNPEVKETIKNSSPKNEKKNFTKSDINEKKNAEQEERILSILKRSPNISRVYRKVCAQMIKYNSEELEERSEVENN